MRGCANVLTIDQPPQSFLKTHKATKNVYHVPILRPVSPRFFQEQAYAPEVHSWSPRQDTNVIYRLTSHTSACQTSHLVSHLNRSGPPRIRMARGKVSWSPGTFGERPTDTWLAASPLNYLITAPGPAQLGTGLGTAPGGQLQLSRGHGAAGKLAK